MTLFASIWSRKNCALSAGLTPIPGDCAATALSTCCSRAGSSIGCGVPNLAADTRSAVSIRSIASATSPPSGSAGAPGWPEAAGAELNGVDAGEADCCPQAPTSSTAPRAAETASPGVHHFFTALPLRWSVLHLDRAIPAHALPPRCQCWLSSSSPPRSGGDDRHQNVVH